MVKEIISLILGLAFGLQIFAQDTLYFDQDWQPSDRATAKFFRLETKKGKLKSFSDHFMEGGQVQNTGQYHRKEKTGEWLWWSKSGQKTMEEHWNKGVRDGAFRVWHSDGSLKKERFYEDGKPAGKWALYDKQGQLEESYDAESDDPMPPTFQNLVTNPQPINMEQIRRSMGYPDLARDSKIEGKVIVKVLIDKEGSVTQRKLLKEAHPLFNGVVMQYIGELKFKPGICDEGPCKVWVSIPFEFKMVDD